MMVLQLALPRNGAWTPSVISRHYVATVCLLAYVIHSVALCLLQSEHCQAEADMEKVFDKAQKLAQMLTKATTEWQQLVLLQISILYIVSICHDRVVATVYLPMSRTHTYLYYLVGVCGQEEQI